MTELTLARGAPADIPFIMATERQPGFDSFVGRWDEARHEAGLRDPRHAYFIGRDDGAPVGFVIVRGWASLDRVTLVQRIAVAEPGRGHGRALLGAVVDSVFRDTDAHRLWLGVFPHNARARRVYEALGFQAEGIARGLVFLGGVHHDEVVMAMLRPDWAARHQGHGISGATSAR
jgi:RimJ/RimL family protein N-acetyltransferase